MCDFLTVYRALVVLILVDLRDRGTSTAAGVQALAPFGREASLRQPALVSWEAARKLVHMLGAGVVCGGVHCLRCDGRVYAWAGLPTT